MDYRRIIQDTSWGAFLVSPAPVARSSMINGNPTLIPAEGASAAKNFYSANLPNGITEMSVQLNSDVSARFLESLQYLERHNIVKNIGMDGDVDLGTWYEFENMQDSNVYILLFVHNIAEYQARQIADGMGFKYWFTPRGYNEGANHYPIEMDGVYFVQKKGQTTLGLTLARSTEWAQKYMNRVPGMVCLNIGTRIMNKAFRKNRMPVGASDLEVSQACADFMAKSAAGGFTFDEMLQKLDPSYKVEALNFSFLLPLKEEV